MIDSLHIRLSREHVNKDQLSALRLKLEDKQPFLQKKYYNSRLTAIANHGTTGKFKGMTVKISKNKITIHGSLPKYLHQNNVQGIPFEDIPKTITQLAVDIGLPLLKGEIQRVDIAESFVVNSNVVNYFIGLESTPSYIRDRDETNKKNGVRYSKDNMVLAFYDKTNEAVKTSAIEFNVDTQQVLRIEFRIQKNVRRTVYYNTKKFGVLNLKSITFLKLFANMWVNHYNAIIKNRKMYEGGAMPSNKYLDKFFISYAIHSMGLGTAIDYLTETARKNNWNKAKKSDAKKEIIAHYNNDLTSIQNKYMKELDDKVKSGYIFSFASAKSVPNSSNQ